MPTPLSGLYNKFVKDADLSFVDGEVVNFEACLEMSDKVANITVLQRRAYNFKCQESIKVFNTNHFCDRRLIYVLSYYLLSRV